MKITEIESGEKEPIDAGSSFEPTFIENIIPLLKQDCGQSINSFLYVKKFLYRGLHGHHVDAFVGRSREYRKPMTSSTIFQDNIDSAFKMVGFTALRSNSIYCTGSLNDAIEYATPRRNLYYIFPKDGFDFTWSPLINDLFVASDGIFADENDYENYHLNREFQREDHRADIPFLELFLKRTKYTSKDFDGAVMSEHEIMIHGEYIAINKYCIREGDLLNALV